MPIRNYSIVLLATLLLALSAAAQENFPLFPILQNKKWGYMNREGKVVIPAQFEYARPFSEGLAQVTIGPRKDENESFIDSQGIPAIPQKYYRAGDFSEGLAPVAFKTKQTSPCVDCSTYDWNLRFGFIDKTGRLVIEASFRDARAFHEGLAAVQGDSRKWGFIDASGKLVIPYSFDYASFFFEGLAAVMHGNAWGYIDKTGKWVLEPRFTSAHSFHEGKAIAKTGGMLDRRECGLPCLLPSGGNWGVLDRKSLAITGIKAFSTLRDYSEGLLSFYSDPDHCGYMDAEGKIAISPQWGSCNDFSEGLALVKGSNDAYYIDHSGRKILSSPTPEAFDFHDGLAQVGQWWPDGDWQGYIDHSGRLVWSSGNLPAKKVKRK